MIVMCFSLFSHACLSFFILQLRCFSPTIVWRARFQVRLPCCQICVSRVACCNDCVMCCSLYSHACLSFIHSTAWLDLSGNSLTGTIPSQIALLSNLCESSVVWLLVVMLVLSCVFHCTLMLACHIHSTARLTLFNNSLTGTIPSQIAFMSNLSESSVVWLLVVMIVLSCVFHCTLMLACHVSIL
jgi:hypothetical protein